MTAEMRTFVDIDAPPERVWQVLMELPAYPEWNPFVTAAEGAFAVGSSPTLRTPHVHPLMRRTVRPLVLEVVPYRRLRFRLRLGPRGVPGLADIEHTLTLAEQDRGVRLWEEARFRGVLLPVLVRSLRRDASSFVTMNTALKSRIEGAQPLRAE